jgi:3',5'-cyclic AMP phosphodiesterase CpdA
MLPIIEKWRFRFAVPFILLAVLCFGQGNDRKWNSIEQLAPKSVRKYSFAIIGDRTGAGADSWGVFDRAIREINGWKPDFAVCIGDVIEGGRSQADIRNQWDEAFRHLAALRVPLFLIPGNHDIPNAAGYTAWKSRYGATFQRFDYAGDRFILLNTEEGAGTIYAGFGDRQLALLDSAFMPGSRSGSRHVFIFMHQPAWLFAGDRMAQWSTVEPKFKGASTRVFAGHLHLLAETSRDGTPYCIVGPTGGRLRLAANPALGFMNHITRVSVDGDSTRVEFSSSGRIYPEKTARDAYERGLKSLLLLRGTWENWD